jgi:hypothetical protein
MRERSGAFRKRDALIPVCGESALWERIYQDDLVRRAACELARQPEPLMREHTVHTDLGLTIYKVRSQMSEIPSPELSLSIFGNVAG